MMIYKPFQEIKLPVFGMGAMRLEGSVTDHAKDQEMIDYALANGINYFDTAYVYGKNGASEKGLGELLNTYPRDSYYLSTKYVYYADKDYKSIFEEQLIRLKTDYIDFYMIHGIGDDTYRQYIENGCIEYFSELKRSGRIKYFGFSSHAGVDALTKFTDCHTWDFVMIQLNYYDWVYGIAKQEYAALTARGLPIMVMEPIRGGRLASLSSKAEAVLKSAKPAWSIASWFLRWVKRLDGVQIVLSGMRTLEHLKENNILFSGDEKLSDEEEKKLFEACKIFREEVSVLCTSCNYCINDCPAEIDIPKIIELYNYLKTDKPWNIKEKIEKADSQVKPAECTGCGICLSRCPQKIDVMGIMRELSSK